MCRDHDRRGDPVRFDRCQSLLGIEMSHEDDRASREEKADGGMGTGMVKRPGHEVRVRVLSYGAEPAICYAVLHRRGRLRWDLDTLRAVRSCQRCR